jgi:hypothetical protein
MEQVLLEKLIAAQLVKKFTTVYTARMFISAFTDAECRRGLRNRPYHHVASCRDFDKTYASWEDNIKIDIEI